MSKLHLVSFGSKNGPWKKLIGRKEEIQKILLYFEFMGIEVITSGRIPIYVGFVASAATGTIMYIRKNNYQGNDLFFDPTQVLKEACAFLDLEFIDES